MAEAKRSLEELEAARAMTTAASLTENLAIIDEPFLLHGEEVPYEPWQNLVDYTYYAKFRGGHHSVGNHEPALKRLDRKADNTVTIPPLQRQFELDFEPLMEEGSWSIAWKYAKAAHEKYPDLEITDHLVRSGSRMLHEWCRSGLFYLNGLETWYERFMDFEELIKMRFLAEELAEYDAKEAVQKQRLITQMMYKYALTQPDRAIYEVSNYFEGRKFVQTDHLSEEQRALVQRVYDHEGIRLIEEDGNLQLVNKMIVVLSIGGLVTREQVEAWKDGIADEATIDYFAKEYSYLHSDRAFVKPDWDLPYMLRDWNCADEQQKRLAKRLQETKAAQLAQLVEDPGILLKHEAFERRLTMSNEGLKVGQGSEDSELDINKAFLEPLVQTLEDGVIVELHTSDVEHLGIINHILGAVQSGSVTHEQAAEAVSRLFISISEGANKNLRRALKQTNVLLSIVHADGWEDIFWSLVDKYVVVGHIDELLAVGVRPLEDEHALEDEAMESDNMNALADLWGVQDEKEELAAIRDFILVSPRDWFHTSYHDWRQQKHDERVKADEEYERIMRNQERRAKYAAKRKAENQAQE